MTDTQTKPDIAAAVADIIGFYRRSFDELVENLTAGVSAAVEAFGPTAEPAPAPAPPAPRMPIAVADVVGIVATERPEVDDDFTYLRSVTVWVPSEHKDAILRIPGQTDAGAHRTVELTYAVYAD